MIRHTVIVATKNAHKVHELRLLLKDLPIDLVAVSDQYPDAPTVVEDGLTFEANAEKKARAIAAHTMTLCLADDSGLEVDALGGAPGIHSARYSGAGAKANVEKLLAALEGVPEAARTARFRCVIAVVDPARPDEPLLATGRCEGAIARAPRGAHGFGYDPIFLPVDRDGRTMAELDDAEKDAISHRGVACRALAPSLASWLRARR